MKGKMTQLGTTMTCKNLQCICFSLTGVDFLMSLKKVFLNEAHITLAAVEGLLTWSVYIVKTTKPLRSIIFLI